MSLIWSTNVRINTEILKIELLILYFFIVVLLNFDVDICRLPYQTVLLSTFFLLSVYRPKPCAYQDPIPREAGRNRPARITLFLSGLYCLYWWNTPALIGREYLCFWISFSFCLLNCLSFYFHSIKTLSAKCH